VSLSRTQSPQIETNFIAGSPDFHTAQVYQNLKGPPTSTMAGSLFPGNAMTASMNLRQQIQMASPVNPQGMMSNWNIPPINSTMTLPAGVSSGSKILSSPVPQDQRLPTSQTLRRPTHEKNPSNSSRELICGVDQFFSAEESVV